MSSFLLLGAGTDKAAGGGGAGLAFDAASTAFLSAAGAASPVSFTGPTVSASATKLAVAAMLENSAASLGTISATYNGSAMTLIAGPASVGGIGSNCCVIFGIMAPASGAKTIAISFSGTSQVMAGAVSWTGGDTGTTTTAFPATASTNSAAAASATLSPAGAGAGKALIAAWGTNNGPFSAVTGTQLFKPGSPTVNFGAGNYDLGTASIGATDSAAGCAGVAALVV